MATVFGTAGNDSWTIAQHGNLVLDGLGGIDTLYIGTEPRSSFEIRLGSDGAVHVDTLSGASQPSFYTLYNVEFVGFDNRRDVVDLRTYFGDSVPPSASFDPAPAGTATGSLSYTLRFSEAVSGLAADDFIASAGTVVSVGGSGTAYTVVVAPPAAFEGTIELMLKAAAVEDAAGNANAQTNAAVRAVDVRAPSALAYNPAEGSANVAPGGPIVVTFSEAVQRAAGSLVLQNASGAAVASYDLATSARITVSGATLTLDPDGDLAAGGSYRLVLPAGAVKDLAGNPLAAAGGVGFSTAAPVAPPPGTLQGSAAADRLVVGAAISAVDGAGGTDTAVFGKPRASYTVSVVNGGTSASVAEGGGSIGLSNVERLEFVDLSLAIDLSGKAGQVAKTLGAVFGAAAVRNAGFVGIGLDLLDGGMSYEALVALAIEARLGAGATSGQIVDLLYANVVGVAPPAADRATFVALLESRALTPGALGMLAAEHALNAANIDLVGLGGSGLAFT